MKIAVINLMPLKQETENHLIQLFQKQKEKDITWIRLASYESKHTSLDYLNEKYHYFHDLNISTYDLFVLTGAPVEIMPFEQVAYFEELKKMIQDIEKTQIPLLSICWGAQLSMYLKYGLPKKNLAEKCFGLFKHDILLEDLKTQLHEPVYFPHSRYTHWDENYLRHLPVTALVHSEEAGCFAIMDDCNLYLSGHMEYDRYALVREYERDLKKKIMIHLPRGYWEKKGQLEPSYSWEENAKKLVTWWLERSVFCKEKKQ